MASRFSNGQPLALQFLLPILGETPVKERLSPEGPSKDCSANSLDGGEAELLPYVYRVVRRLLPRPATRSKSDGHVSDVARRVTRALIQRGYRLGGHGDRQYELGTKVARDLLTQIGRSQIP